MARKHDHFPSILLRVYDDPADAALAWIFRDGRLTDRRALAKLLIERRRKLREIR